MTLPRIRRGIHFPFHSSTRNVILFNNREVTACDHVGSRVRCVYGSSEDRLHPLLIVALPDASICSILLPISLSVLKTSFLRVNWPVRMEWSTVFWHVVESPRSRFRASFLRRFCLNTCFTSPWNRTMTSTTLVGSAAWMLWIRMPFSRLL